MQLRRLAQQHSADAHLDSVERLTQRGWRGEIGGWDVLKAHEGPILEKLKQTHG